MNFAWSLENRLTGAVIVPRLAVATNVWSRLWGLQFRQSLPADCGLMLAPCAGIHTFWMRFPIDLVFLSRSGEVLGIRRHIRPWRIANAPRQTHCVLEVCPGVLDLNPGDSLKINPLLPDQRLPSALADFRV